MVVTFVFLAAAAVAVIFAVLAVLLAVLLGTRLLERGGERLGTGSELIISAVATDPRGLRRFNALGRASSSCRAVGRVRWRVHNRTTPPNPSFSHCFSPLSAA